MHYAIGIVTLSAPATQRQGFNFAVYIGKTPFIIKNEKDFNDDTLELTQAVVVQYEPADQFCEVVPLDRVQQALTYYAQHYTTDQDSGVRYTPPAPGTFTPGHVEPDSAWPRR